MKRMELIIEKSIFASRWLVAPLYIGLCLSLLMLLYAFGNTIIHCINHVESFDETKEVIVIILELIDLSLIGNLVILVVFSGYENFVSLLELGEHEDVPYWKGTVDFSSLKIKLISSIIAIASVYLLKLLMGLKEINAKDIMWPIVIYIVLVGSGLVLSLMDYIYSLAQKNTKNASRA